MLRRTCLTGLICIATASAAADDAVHTDGDKYRVRVDNAHVRVLEYRDEPGAKTAPHRHPRFVVVALAPFKRRLHLSDGRTLERQFSAGDVLYSDGESHVGENVGTTPTHVMLIEMKGD
jgi:quercetin dioxygenase-like cupin family protein